MSTFRRQFRMVVLAVLVTAGLAASVPPTASGVHAGSGPLGQPGRPGALRATGRARLARSLPAGVQPLRRRAFPGWEAGSALWAQQAKLTAGDGLPNDNVGGAVALWGTTALVAASAKNNATGAVYVFGRSGTPWSQQAVLTATTGAPGDHFGYAATLWGPIAVIGAPGRNGSTGAAYVFVHTRAGWVAQATLTAADGGAGDAFGSSVALWGNTVVIGAPGKNGGRGAAYVFVLSSSGWAGPSRPSSAPPTGRRATPSAARWRYGAAPRRSAPRAGTSSPAWPTSSCAAARVGPSRPS